MAEFAVALMHLMNVESRSWSNFPDDKGGETYAGWSRVHHEHLPMWVIIDNIKAELGYDNSMLADREWRKKISSRLAQIPELQSQVDSGLEQWFKSECLHLIKSQRVANVIFQASIQFGKKKSAGWVQMVCLTNGTLKREDIDYDIGMQTVEAVNAIPEERFIKDFFKHNEYYLEIAIVRDPGQIGMKAGYERRIAYYRENS